MSDNFVGKRILQPKREIMTFLASQGVRVPHIYSSLDEAVGDMEGERIMLRSEHPQDYEGSSDLFPNGTLDRELLSLIKADDITSAIMSQSYQYIKETIRQIELHCELLGLDYDEFMKDFSHSAWERIKGTNRVVCADSAIEGRYHIITLDPKTSYDVVEDSRIKPMADRPLFGPMELEEATGLIMMYEQIRDNMDPNHCYIVETQTVRNLQSSTFDHFAVQVHRGTDSQKINFKAKPKGFNSIRFYKVRGATPSAEGEDLLLTISYPYDFREHPKLIVEDASIQASEHYVAKAFSEIMFRRRRLHIFPYVADGLGYELRNHSSRNSLLKPNCSILTYGPHIWDEFGDLSRQDGLVQMNVNLVSDGREAYLSLPE